MTVSLTNKSGRCLVFVLAHETYCKALGACRCDVVQGRRARRTPKSLTLPSGVTSHSLDDAVLSIPDVVRAVKRGELVVKLPKPVAESPKTPTPTPEVRHPDAKAKKARGVS